MRLLVTGGQGFVGRSVVRYVSENHPEWTIFAPSRAELDWCEERSVLKYWAKVCPQGLIHLAAFARGLGGNLAAGHNAFVINEAINRNVLLAALEYGVTSIVMGGTVAEYGYPYGRIPLREEEALRGQPHGGELYYSLAKRLSESYLNAIQVRWGSRVSHALLTNMYGPGDRFDRQHGHVVSSMLLSAVDAKRRGERSVTFWGRPETTRDFLYVDDAAEALVQLLNFDLGLVNVASGHPTRMEELSASVIRALRLDLEVLWDSDKPVGIPHRYLDVSKLTSVMHFRPRCLQQGLDETVKSESWLLEEVTS